jgi:putative transposase
MTGSKKNLASCPYETKVLMVEKNNPDLSLYKQTQLLNISRSFCYYIPKSNTQADIIMTEIDEIYTKYPFYGARRIKADRHPYISTCRLNKN